MVTAVLAADGSGFFWNIDANVGRNCPNKPEDVELVRFGYTCMAQFPTTPPELKRLIAAMNSVGGYAADLQAVIDLHEQLRGGARDGHVSKVPAGVMVPTYDGAHNYIVLALNPAMRMADPRQWPRIDLAPKSGAWVSAKARKVFNV